MAESDHSDKTESPSEHKLSEARKKGQIVKSAEVNLALFAAATIMLVLMFGRAISLQFAEEARNLIVQTGRHGLTNAFVLASLRHAMYTALVIIAPLMGLLCVVAIAGTALQSGIVLSSEPVKPDFERLNPASGIKKIISIKMLFEAVKSLGKLLLLAAVLNSVLKGMLPEILSLLTRNVQSYLDFFIDHFATVTIKILMVLAVFAVIDYVFVNWDFLKKMRMSKQEVKEEHKRREGDPKIKSKQREIQRQLRKRSESVKKVPNADVIITNPTRLAVLLKYDNKTMKAPIVIGKATGRMVIAVKNAASRYQVPVIESKELTRKIYRIVKIDAPIEESMYKDVAKILKQAYLRRRRMQQRFANRPGHG